MLVTAGAFTADAFTSGIRTRLTPELHLMQREARVL
jgi:hypothetical protein